MATKVEPKVIDTGISAKHARNWTVANAMRELVQNWLDVRNEFKCGGSISYKDGMATIKDLGPGLQMKHLAFGENDKAAGSIGQFGEGMKSAFIVLVRNEMSIEIRSNGMIIRPEIRYSETFGTDTLHYDISPMAARHAAKLHGTVIHTNCSEDDLNTGKSYFVELIRQERKGAAKRAKKEGRTVNRTDLTVGFQWMQKGKISLPGGLIYVKGSVIGTLAGAAFSYHLDGVSAEQATNRDRDAVNMDVVGPIIDKMIAETSSRKVMDKVIRSMFSKSEAKTWESRRALRVWSTKSARIWHRVWNAIYGSKFLLSYNSDTDRQAEYKGYKVLYGAGYDVKAFLNDIGIQDTANFQPKEKKAGMKKIGIRLLTPEQYANYKYAIAMTKKHYADPGKVVVVDQCPYGWSAMYDPAKETVYVNHSVLDSRHDSLHLILHETVHKVSGCKDETAAFERALLEVAVRMITAPATK